VLVVRNVVTVQVPFQIIDVCCLASAHFNFHGFMTMHLNLDICASIVFQIVCLFVCFELHEQFFSYLVTVTFGSDRAANSDLCLGLTAFSSEGSFT
jgi:hypothetical protein